MTPYQRVLFFAIGAICFVLVFAAMKVTPSLNVGHKIALTLLLATGLSSALYAVWR